jgi:DNA repair exonuclease SbcCD nuclease subunit
MIFVHCADLHLDSPFEGLRTYAPEIAEALRNATFQAFEHVIDLALREGADFLLVAGDVYDSETRSLRAQLRFRDALRRAAESGIPCYVVYGNHDPLSGWEARISLPDNVYRFGPALTRLTVVRDGDELADIYGVSYPRVKVGENLAALFKRSGDVPFAIGLLHCNVGGDPNHENYAPCSLTDLRVAGLDYWALGHIHNRAILQSSGPCVVYAGNTQGRSVRELGPRGCYLVRGDAARQPQPEFVASDTVRWFQEEVSITGLASEGDLLERLETAREEIRTSAEGRGALVRLRVSGRGELHPKLRRLDPERDLAAPLREDEADRSDFVWTESVELGTRPVLDLEQRRQVQDFVGDFLRLTQAHREVPDVGATMREMMDSVPGARLVWETLNGFTEDAWQQILDDAEGYGLDRLLVE